MNYCGSCVGERWWDWGAKSKAVPHGGLCRSDRERKERDKTRVCGNKKTGDMKEEQEQERGTVTKDGKA